MFVKKIKNEQKRKKKFYNIVIKLIFAIAIKQSERSGNDSLKARKHYKKLK